SDRHRAARESVDRRRRGRGRRLRPAHAHGAPYSTIVEQVNFGSSPVEPAPLEEQGRRAGGPLNRRAEMWMKSKEWLEQACGVQVPDSGKLQADACGPGYRYDSLTRLLLESKEDMRRRGALSPDEWTRSRSRSRGRCSRAGSTGNWSIRGW